MSRLFAAALLLAAGFAFTAQAEVPRSPVTEQVHTYEYEVCNQVVLILLLRPDKPPQVVRKYQSEEHRRMVDKLREQAQENGNAYRFEVENSRCPEI